MSSGRAAPLRTGRAARLIGVAASTLRIMANRGQVRCALDAAGRRLFDAEDVRRMRRLRRLASRRACRFCGRTIPQERTKCGRPFCRRAAWRTSQRKARNRKVAAVGLAAYLKGRATAERDRRRKAVSRLTEEGTDAR